MAERLFFALLPDAATANHIARRTRATCCIYSVHPHLIQPERFHVSLLGMPDLCTNDSLSLLDDVRALAASIIAPVFNIVFEQAMSFKTHPGHCAYVLRSFDPSGHLRALRLALASTFCLPARSFTPHLTLFYAPEMIAAHPIAPLSWPVREFALVRSFVGQGRYELLGRWPLHAS